MRAIALALISNFLLNAEVLGQNDPDLESIFRVEAPQKWEEYRRASSAVRGLKKGREILRYNLDGKPSGWKEIVRGEWTEKIKHNNVAACLERHGVFNELDGDLRIVKKTNLHEVLCSNSKYAFQLQGKADEGHWKLGWLDLATEKGSVNRARSIEEDAQKSISPHFAFVDNIPFEVMIKHNFQIRKAVLIKSGLIKIEFSLEKTAPKDVHKYRGWMLMDAANFWCCQAAQIELMTNLGTQTLTCHYEYTIARGVPLIQSVILKDEAQKKGPNGETGYRELIHEYQLEVADVPDREFGLSAFGLPEPQGVVWTRGESRWYLWLSGLAVSALAVGAYYRWRSRRRAPAAMSGPAPPARSGPSQIAATQT